MICLVSREERRDKSLVDKITKLKATMMTRDLFAYSRIAEQVDNIANLWRKARDNPSKNLIEERTKLKASINLTYLVMTTYQSENNLPLFQNLTDGLNSLTIKQETRAA